jgi:hypothetical protein
MASTQSYFESHARALFRRCLVCPDDLPSCPTCSNGLVCSLIPATCDTCPSTICVDGGSVGADNDKSSAGGSAAGPVAGGVVGGIVVIALITFLVWKFCVKKRRRNAAATAANEWPDSNLGSEKDGGMERFSVARDNRASTHTVGSVASTVFTRASNIIQIAYIPGVTNRSINSSHDLVPPVPPIPAVSAPTSGHNTPRIGTEDQHFFMPSDLRNSTFSNFTDRNSVASTMYRSNAIVSPIPAQMAARGKAVPVSVKSSRNSPTISRSTTPPVPSVPEGHTLNTKSSIVGRVGVPRPVQITRKGSSNQTPIYELDGSGSEASYSPYMTVPDRNLDNVSPQFSHHSSAFDDASSDEEYGSTSSKGPAGRRLMGKDRQYESTTIQEERPVSPVELPSHRASGAFDAKTSHRKSTSLNQIIEDAARNASRDPRHGGLGSYEQDQDGLVSPFADAHATRTP